MNPDPKPEEVVESQTKPEDVSFGVNHQSAPVEEEKDKVNE